MLESKNNQKREWGKTILTMCLLILGPVLILGTVLEFPAFDFLKQYFSVKEFTEKLFTTALGIVCLVLGLERKDEFGGIKERLSDVSTKLKELTELVNTIDTQNIIKRIQRLGVKHFDPLLNDLFADFIDSNVHSLINGIEDKKITFDEKDRFIATYIKCLKRFEGSHFLATSSAHPNYFWTRVTDADSPIEKQIAQFIKSNGKMTRVFFVEPDFMDDAYVVSVLEKQAALGVEVYTVSNVPPSEQRFMIVGDQITWRLYTDSEKNIIKFVCSANERDINRYKETFKILEAYQTYRRYIPQEETNPENLK